MRALSFLSSAALLAACATTEPDAHRLDSAIADLVPPQSDADYRGVIGVSELDFCPVKLTAGQRADLVVVGADPSESVTYVGGTGGIGPGPCPAALGGLCLDVATPLRRLGSATADPLGTAIFPITAPSTPGLELCFQGMAKRGPGGVDSVKSDVECATIAAPPLSFTVFAGHDVLQTAHASQTAFIPADLLGPGCGEFDGELEFHGVPIGEYLGTPVGDADTIVQRLNDVDLSGVGSAGETPIQLVALHLQSVEPVDVGSCTDSSGRFNVFVDLGDELPIGNMVVIQEADGGGFFDSFLPVCPLFTFVDEDDPAIQVTVDGCAVGPAIEFTAFGPWSYDSSLEQYPPLTTNFNIGEAPAGLPFGCPEVIFCPCPVCVTPEEALLASHGVLPAGCEEVP